AAHDFLPFSYAVAVHGKDPLIAALKSSLGYLTGGIAYVALPLVLVFFASRSSRDAITDSLKPKEPARQLVALAFWLSLLLPPIVAPFIGISINSLWTMSAWTLLPVVLLSSPLIRITREAASRIVLIAVAVPFIFLAASTLIAAQIQSAGVAP